MHLVQLLLPTRDREGRPFSDDLIGRTRTNLVDRFGGVTAYVRAPAAGAWVAGDGRVERDDVVMLEVMVDTLDRAWWREYGVELARRFGQEALLIRAMPVEDLTVGP